MTIPIGIQSRFVSNSVTGSYRGGAATGGAGGTSSLSIASSAVGAQSGDLLLCFLAAGYDTKSGSMSSLPAGFTSIANSMNVNIGTKTATGSEPANYTTGTGTNDFGITMHIIAVYGATQVDVDSPAPATVNDTTSTVTAPSVTTTIGGFLICFWLRADSTDTFTAPASMTARTTRSNPYGYSIVATEQLIGAGATGNRTTVAGISGGITRSEWAYTVALK